MKKIISWAWSLFGHRFCLKIEVGPDIKGELEKRNRGIVRDFKEGRSVEFLAAIHNMTENWISRILIDHKARQPKWRKMGQIKRRMVFRLQKKGFSKAEIGRRVGVTRERARQILEQK